VLLFFFSDYFYCGYSSSQCISPAKKLGIGGVCLGILLFSFDERIASYWGFGAGQGTAKEFSDGGGSDHQGDDDLVIGDATVMELQSLRVREPIG
jgi:hypothetical protein